MDPDDYDTYPECGDCKSEACVVDPAKNTCCGAWYAERCRRAANGALVEPDYIEHEVTDGEAEPNCDYFTDPAKAQLWEECDWEQPLHCCKAWHTEMIDCDGGQYTYTYEEQQDDNSAAIFIIVVFVIGVSCAAFKYRAKQKRKVFENEVIEWRAEREKASFAFGGNPGGLVEAQNPGNTSTVIIVDPYSKKEMQVTVPPGIPVGGTFQVHTGTCPANGAWSGSYNETPWGDTGPLATSYKLIFDAMGKMKGDVTDDDGTFPVSGSYNIRTGKVAWGEFAASFTTECKGKLMRQGPGWRIDAEYISTQGYQGTMTLASVEHLAVPPPQIAVPGTLVADPARVKSGEIPGGRKQPTKIQGYINMMTASPPKGSSADLTKVVPEPDEEITTSQPIQGTVVGQDLIWAGPVGGMEKGMPGRDSIVVGQAPSATPVGSPTHLRTSVTSADLTQGLPPGWKAYRDPATGFPYYVQNGDTATCTWTRPS